ncbi:MAG: VRR-NUC domain-containing protein [Chloroflexi bacterium]|nr:VRR-NUC domain-containing protein [Chloroflexota bacterium]
MTERELQDAIVQVARLHGWLVYHTYDSRRSDPGFPDLVLVHVKRGQLWFLECKSARGRVTPEQQDWLSALGALHVVIPNLWVAVVRPAMYDVVLARLARQP